VNRVVLDSGALIALERNDRTIWAMLKLVAQSGAEVLVPTTALAQVWRAASTQAALSRALRHCETASFDRVAREVGELCGRTRTSDICDAHVALVAATLGDALYTSDPEDMRALMPACGKRRPKIVRC
jgi:predicted nucleic acid-binding protein